MKRRGFTLVELILSLSLLLLLLSGMFFSFGQVLKTWRKTASKAERQQIANLIADRICYDIRSASEVLPSSGSEEIVLRINAETIAYRAMDHKIRRKKGATVAYLTNEGEIEKLLFAYPAAKVVGVAVENLTSRVFLRN